MTMVGRGIKCAGTGAIGMTHEGRKVRGPPIPISGFKLKKTGTTSARNEVYISVSYGI